MGKFSKFVTWTALTAAAGAGVFYYLNKTQLESAKNTDEGVSGTGTTAQDSVADFFREKKDTIVNSREYVTLTENAKTAKDTLVKTVSEAAEKIKEKAAEAKEGVGVVADDLKDKAEDFEFEEFEEAKAEAIAEVEEAEAASEV